MMRTAKFVAACAAFTAAPLMVRADLLIDAGPTSTTQVFGTGNYVAGTEFTLSAPTTIRSLGYLDAEGDGLAGNHRVGLWDVATQTLMASVTVTPGSARVGSAQPTARWYVEGIPDLVLPAGTYRVAGEVNNDGGARSNDKIAGPNTTLTAGYVRNVFPSGGFTYPDLSFTSEAIRVTVSTDAVNRLIVDAGAASTTQAFGTGNYVAGSEFTLSVPTTIRSLGWLDAEGNGLDVNHRIGVWNTATQTLLASTTVSPASASIPSVHGTARWVMGRIQDLVLPAGTYRVAGEVNGDAVALSNDKVPGPNTVLTAGYIRTDFPSGGFAYPNLSFGSEAVRATLSTQAVTNLIVDAGPGSVNSVFSTGNYVAGTEFTISAPTTIRSLGWLDAEGDGLTQTHKMGLWNAAGEALITTAIVTPGSPTILAANGTAKWFMGMIAPVTLPAGTYRVAGEVNGDNLTLANDKLPGPNTSLTAGYVRTDFPNGGFAYPNLTFGTNAVRATASLRGVATSTVITFDFYPGPDGRLGTPDDVPVVAPTTFLAQTLQLTNQFASVGVQFRAPVTEDANEILDNATFANPIGSTNPNLLASNGTLIIDGRFTIPVYEVGALIGISGGSDRLTAFDAANNVLGTVVGDDYFVSIRSTTPIARFTVAAETGTTPAIDNLTFDTASSGPAPCYANCDGSTIPPVLNVSDFICFQTKYAAGDPYANCDNSTIPPILNVSDFICFQTKYSAGCP